MLGRQHCWVGVTVLFFFFLLQDREIYVYLSERGRGPKYQCGVQYQQGGTVPAGEGPVGVAVPARGGTSRGGPG